MAGRCLCLDKRSLVIAITLVLLNGLHAAVGASTLGHRLSAQTPAPTQKSTPSDVPTDIPTHAPTPTFTLTPTPVPTSTPVPMPDLIVAGITVDPSPLLKGQPGTVRVEVKNEGSGGTTIACWVGLYVRRSPVGDPDQEMPVPALGADQSTAVFYTVALAEVGHSALTAWVDWLEAIPEEDEANNQHSASILVVEPTPTPSSTSTPVPTPTPSPTLPLTPSATPSITCTSTRSPTPSSTNTSIPTRTRQPGEAPNLVVNGGFEGAFASHGGLGEVAEGWAPFVETEGMPQFLRDGDQARGQASQRIWADYVPFRAGIRQRVAGVTPGQTYIARAEMLSIFGEGDTPVQGMNIGKQIGLDPQGGEDGSSPKVIWSDVNWEDRAWQEGDNALWVSATAGADAITLFIRVNNVYGGHNDLFYVDEVTLHLFEPTPIPTYPATSTATETPTSTPLPSSTVTVPPAGASTPSATPLPRGTATRTSVATLIPVGEGPPPSMSTPTPVVSPAGGSIRRFIPLFFVLALVIIVTLIAAILWLQEPRR